MHAALTMHSDRMHRLILRQQQCTPVLLARELITGTIRLSKPTRDHALAALAAQ